MVARLTSERSKLFKAATVLSSAFGGGLLGVWAFSIGHGATTPGAIATNFVIGGLSALAASGCALAFFQGIDAHASAIRAASATDTLTGIASRRQFLIDLDRASSERKGSRQNVGQVRRLCATTRRPSAVSRRSSPPTETRHRGRADILKGV